MEAENSRESASSGLLFVSYARQDSEVVDALLKDIDSIRFEENFDVFRDNRSISSGETWDARIKEALESCDLAILVISVNYWSSPYIREKELPILQQRYSDGAVQILPVLASSVSKKAGPEWVRAIQFFDGMNPLPPVESSDFREKSVRLADEVADRIAGLQTGRVPPPPVDPDVSSEEVAPPEPDRGEPEENASEIESSPKPVEEAINAAIEHFRNDRVVQQWLSTTGQTPWMNVQTSIEDGLVQQGVPEADARNGAYQYVVTALDRVFGPETWHLEKRPRKNDPEKTTTWIVLETAEVETG